MAARTFALNTDYGPRQGLEGPFRFLNGQTLYYDPREGQYWDPKTDFYVDNAVVADLQQRLVDVLGR